MRWFTRVAWLLAAILVAGCVGRQSAKNGAVRILNAVPDGPFVALYVNGTLSVGALDYGGGSAYVPLGAGTYDFIVQKIKPGDSTTTCKTPPLPANCVSIADQAIDVNDEYTYVLVGSVADGSEEEVPILTRTTAVPAGQTRVQFLNASSGIGPVDVYVTEPTALLPSNSPTVAGLAYKLYTGQQTVTAGTWRIRVTPPGDPNTVLFDSGSVAFAREADLLLSVIDYVGPGSAQHPLALSEMTGISAGVLVDRNVAGSFRIVHAAPGAGAVDVSLTAGSGNTNAPPVVPPGLAYGAVTPSATSYLDLLVGLWTVTYKDSADNTKTLLASSLGSVAGGARTLILAGATTLQQLTIADSLRRVATEARVRLVYTSPTAGAVDIYVQPSSTTDLSTVSPNVTAAVLGSDTGLLVYADGDYTITLTATGSKTDIKMQTPLHVVSGGVYTGIVADCPTGSTCGGFPLQPIALDDFPPPP